MNAPIAENTLHAKVSEINSRLRKLDLRLSRVTSNICGSAPESGEASAKPIDEHVHDKLDATYRIVGAISKMSWRGLRTRSGRINRRR